eukprot:429476-Pelagomonas_calceolata.AAC.4
MFTGAGLGGGSGNAATTLWAANELLGRPATTKQLLEWSGDIGSDISVFFRCKSVPCHSCCCVARRHCCSVNAAVDCKASVLQEVPASTGAEQVSRGGCEELKVTATLSLLTQDGSVCCLSAHASHGAAYCTGRGEIVEDVTPPLPLTTPLLLVRA